MLGLLSTAVSVSDADRSLKWRLEDLKFYTIEEARGEIRSKVEMCKAISNLSALIAGFCMIMLVEAPIPDGLPDYLIIIFAFFSGVTICIMISVMVTCSLILVGICRYDVKVEALEGQPFDQFWLAHCASSWKRSFKLFSYGIPFFLCSLSVLGFIKFASYSIVSPICIAILCVVTIAGWLRLHLIWTSFLVKMDHDGGFKEETSILVNDNAVNNNNSNLEEKSATTQTITTTK